MLTPKPNSHMVVERLFSHIPFIVLGTHPSRCRIHQFMGFLPVGVYTPAKQTKQNSDLPSFVHKSVQLKAPHFSADGFFVQNIFFFFLHSSVFCCFTIFIYLNVYFRVQQSASGKRVLRAKVQHLNFFQTDKHTHKLLTNRTKLRTERDEKRFRQRTLVETWRSLRTK